MEKLFCCAYNWISDFFVAVALQLLFCHFTLHDVVRTYESAVDPCIIFEKY